MIEVKIFNKQTCDRLLNYQSDSCIRELYDNKEQFDFDFEYLSETLEIDMNEQDIQWGIKPADDLNNSIKIYNGLKSIDLVGANDRRLWVTLSHTIFYKYASARWNVDAKTSSNTIKDRFHFEGSSQRTRNQHSLARLWWASRITIDKSLDDPFHMTRMLWEKQDVFKNLIDRKYSTYAGTLKGFLKFYGSRVNQLSRGDLRKLFKGLNALGGVRVLSMMNEEEIIEQLDSLCKFYKIETREKNLVF